MVVTSVTIWILRLLKVQWDSEALDMHLKKIPRNLSWRHFIISCVWKCVAIISNIFSIVLLLLFLWLHLLFHGEFGNYKLENQMITKHDFLSKLSNLEEPIKAKNYLYLFPFCFFIIPVLVNIWAKKTYIGLKNEYSIAITVLSCFIPTRYALSITYYYVHYNIFKNKNHNYYQIIFFAAFYIR